MELEKLVIPMTSGERQLIDQAAAITGQSPEEFATEILVRVASDRNRARKEEAVRPDDEDPLRPE